MRKNFLTLALASTLIAGVATPALASDDEVTNHGDSIYLHVRAHGNVEGHVLRTVLELESDSVRWGICGGLAWVGYDAGGHAIQYNVRDQAFCISGKEIGRAHV